jgi:hypothetical protein
MVRLLPDKSARLEIKSWMLRRWTSNLPVALLVQIAKCHRIREQLVQLFGHLQAYRLFQVEWQSMAHGSVGLNFSRTLMKTGLGVHATSSFGVNHSRLI